MEDGDLVLAIIAALGFIAAAAIIVVDDWRNRSKPRDTRKVTTGPRT
ncbi:MAG TPA: hypothetical protein VMA53_01150 [Stellaceae bacterium]|nr:hypothetical protein [Stellaceae bacterium]